MQLTTVSSLEGNKSVFKYDTSTDYTFGLRIIFYFTFI